MNQELSIQRASNGFLTTAMTANDVIAQVKLIQDVMGSVMKKDEHYGIIPGCKKPSLYKSGAEKLCLLFRLSPAFDTQERYEGMHYTVKSKCVLTHIPTGQVIGSGEGLCSTHEKKWSVRRDGTANENLADTYNTILKMANKRALVAASLVATAASDIFTQDVEDMPTVVIDADATVKPQDAPQSTQTAKEAPKAAPRKPDAPKAAPAPQDGQYILPVGEEVDLPGHECEKCNQSRYKVGLSKSQKNPNRLFFQCMTKDCGEQNGRWFNQSFGGWLDEVLPKFEEAAK